MTNTNTSNESVSLRDVANGFSSPKVTAMVTKIKASFERRDDFEVSHGLALTLDSSYTRERDRMLKNAPAVARLFLALGIEPASVIERKVSETSMFNAKALKKVTEIARFVCGFGERLERVMRAFIACALLATDKGVNVITNDVNRAFLNAHDLSAHITDADLLDNIDSLRHRAMSSGDATQSSQARNVLDVLGFGTIMSVTKPRDAISLDTSHAFFAQFRATFMK